MWLVCSIETPDFLKNQAHIPFSLIQTIKEDVDLVHLQASIDWADCIILSSKQTIQYIKGSLPYMVGKKIVVTGQKTFESLPKNLQITAFIGPSEDQEGIWSVIKKINPSKIFYPHAQKIRPYLLDKIKDANISLKQLICYQTKVVKKPYPTSSFQKVYLGSTSQAIAFFQQFGQNQSISYYVTSGHVTQSFVKKMVGDMPVLTKKEWLENDVNF